MRIVVVGTGSIGMRHIALLRETPGVEVVAVPTRASRVEELRAAGLQATNDLAEALEGAQGAIVATDTGRHVADTLQCLARCPVLVEKPLATSCDDGLLLAARAESAKRTLHVATCLRFDRGLDWIRRKLPALGTLRLADAECLSWLPSWRPGRDHRSTYAARAGEGGVLLDLVHEIDIAHWLFGPARTVTATLENRGSAGLPEIVEETALLTLNHGALSSTIRLSYGVAPTTRIFRIWGEGGQLTWDYIQRLALLRGPDGKEIERFTWVGGPEMYRAQIDEWLGGLRGSPISVLSTAAQAAQVLSTCDAARTSTQQARVETRRIEEGD